MGIEFATTRGSQGLSKTREGETDSYVPNNQKAISTDASFRFNMPRNRALNSGHDDDAEPDMGSRPDEEGDRFIALFSIDRSWGSLSLSRLV